MPDRINQHGFPEGVVVCTHCGTHVSRKDELGCIDRFVTSASRPRPASFDAARWEIGERAAQIRAEEDAARAGSI